MVRRALPPPPAAVPSCQLRRSFFSERPFRCAQRRQCVETRAWGSGGTGREERDGEEEDEDEDVLPGVNGWEICVHFFCFSVK